MIFHLLPSPHPARQNAIRAVMEALEGWIVEIKEPKRNLEQNAAMWPILSAWSNQKEWPVNGKMTRLTPDEWKDILTAAFDREAVRVAQGLDGGMVLLGHRTSTWGKKKFAEWLDWLYAASHHHGVVVQKVDRFETEGRVA